MNSKRVFQLILGGLLLGAIASISSVVFANQLLQNNAGKLDELKLENKVLEQQELALIQARQDVKKFSSLKNIARSIVPQEKDQARAVREIIAFAQDNNITIANISFPASNLGQITPKASTPESSATDNNAPAPAAPSITQVKPVEGISGVFRLETVIQSDDENPISFEQLTGFLERLEQNRRTAHVSNLTIRQPDNTDRSKLAFTLTVNVYIKP